MDTGIFSRNVPGTTARLQQCCVGIAGCGGLGSNVAVALTRAGVGRLILVDFDGVEESNLNRQHFYQDDIGRSKVSALSGHLIGINPQVDLIVHQERVTPDNVATFFGTADLLVEAFDEAASKHFLIEQWCRSFPDRFIVSGNGLGGYGMTDSVRVIEAGKIRFCGDATTPGTSGLCAARVGLVANMQANVAVELLLGPFQGEAQ